VERFSTPQELGPKLNRTAGDVIRFFFLRGQAVTATQPLTDEMIELYAKELGAKVRIVEPSESTVADIVAKHFASDPEPRREVPRPPIVTVMGHVDHGKTLLLDRIRHTNVVAQEAGGITQHIGAYQIEWQGNKLTFIDTPGHEAFTQMRARGANVTDIVVLVVAADDGVMPQTEEAISHARAAGVPIVVAINKIDKEDADPTRVMQQLAERGLVPEAWGGDTVTVQLSALTGQGIDELLEYLVLVAELQELRCDPTARVRAPVLEASMEVGRGPVATVIPLDGTLKVGDPVVAGSAWGRVKALVNDQGRQVKEAPPAYPVQVVGLSEPPEAGDELRVADSVNQAREIAEEVAEAKRAKAAATVTRLGGSAARLESVSESVAKGEEAVLRLVLKADVHGTLEAIVASLEKLKRPEVEIEIVHKGVGGITESDVTLAAVTNAVIFGFNVRPDRRAREVAESEGVQIRTYEIIYDLIEDLEKALKGLLKPEVEEVVTGEAEVRAVFRIPKIGAVAGCYVRHGVITRGSKVRFLRDGVVIWKGTISSLKRFKDDVREVQAGYECGVGLSDFQDLKVGDVIETYEERLIEPE
jgi:translation initiation factor IF-2